jgi:AcrR family transcriptional regulator
MEIAAPIAVAGMRRVMARPREFDETTVLEAAMNRFWAQGFEQTSVRDLAEQMGITGASLYNAFGDKRSLYRQAFVHYLAQTARDRVARLDKLPPAQAILLRRDHRAVGGRRAAPWLYVGQRGAGTGAL